MSEYRFARICLALLGAAGLLACKKNQPADPPAEQLSSPVPQAPAPSTPPPASPEKHEETAPAAPDPKKTISGTISVPPSRRKGLTGSDAVFIVARRAGAPPGPGSMVASQKHALGSFPMPFTLSARDSMLPGIPLKGRLDVSVRIDRDGDPMTRKKGDLFGQANDIAVGTQDLAISVDSVQAEDQILPGMPPGDPRRKRMPPTHP